MKRAEVVVCFQAFLSVGGDGLSDSTPRIEARWLEWWAKGCVECDVLARILTSTHKCPEFLTGRSTPLPAAASTVVLCFSYKDEEMERQLP